MSEQANNMDKNNELTASVVQNNVCKVNIDEAVDNVPIWRIAESQTAELVCEALAGSMYNVCVEKDVTAQLTVEYNDKSLADNVRFVIDIMSGAKADLAFVQNMSKGGRTLLSIEINVHDNAQVSLSTVILGQDSTDNDIVVNMKGEHSEATINGLYIQSGKSCTNVHVRMNHDVPHCKSAQLFKGVVGDEAQCAFSGLIKVAPDAQKTEAYQTNRNMLLSDKARVKAEPHLEIYADDVKCSHGATTGQLDSQQLFYMQQRGIDIDTARQLLMAAFASEVVSKIPIARLREELSVQLTNVED